MNREHLIKVLQAPHVTEKANLLADKYKQYVFKVATRATKMEIKKAVELMFEVGVEKVTTNNVRGKRKFFKRRLGVRPNWKKAYIKLKSDQEIDFNK